MLILMSRASENVNGNGFVCLDESAFRLPLDFAERARFECGEFVWLSSLAITTMWSFRRYSVLLGTWSGDLIALAAIGTDTRQDGRADKQKSNTRGRTTGAARDDLRQRDRAGFQLVGPLRMEGCTECLNMSRLFVATQISPHQPTRRRP